jgi:hypothetical protein
MRSPFHICLIIVAIPTVVQSHLWSLWSSSPNDANYLLLNANSTGLVNSSAIRVAFDLEVLRRDTIEQLNALFLHFDMFIEHFRKSLLQFRLIPIPYITVLQEQRTRNHNFLSVFNKVKELVRKWGIDNHRKFSLARTKLLQFQWNV